MSATLHGLILAGGHSRRMGQDKAGLVYHARAQAQHLAQLLGPYCRSVRLSLRAEQRGADYANGLEPILDHYAAPSPLNGIVSAMRAVPGASWLVVAVDMPAITPHAIATLIAARDPAAIATCFASPVKGGPDPLFAIWEAHGFTALEARLTATRDHVCPRRALKALGAKIIHDGVAADVLVNINTPEEFAALHAERV